MPTQRRNATPSASEQAFLDALRREFQPNSSNITPSAPDETIQQFALIALSDAQIRQFALQSNVHEPDRFFETLDHQDAWSLARQPLDLVQLILAWNQNKQLGTQTELVKTQIDIGLQEDPDRPVVEALPDIKARAGAERLAVALPLTGNLIFTKPHPRHPEEPDATALDPAEVLSDWTPSERDTLLRLPIFEPAAYGRFRFRHRSLQEYLAARRLARLRDRGMTTPALHRHLFRRMYGIDVVIPSRRPIAAWLAIWDSGVRQELLRREPEIFLAHGDPQALSIADRRNVIRALTFRYGTGGYRGVFDGPDRNKLRRFAHPDLADAVNECWPKVDNDELQEVLLVLIELGPIRSCAPIAVDVARSPRSTDNQRLLAIAALVACDTPKPVREVLDAASADPNAWPGGPPPNLARIVFPNVISVDELMALVAPVPDARREGTHTEWIYQDIANTVDPESSPASTLRDRLADSILAGSTSTSPFDLRSDAEHLSHALAILCWRQLEASADPIPQPLLRACAVASLFTAHATPVDAIRRLRQSVQEGNDLRRGTFWATIAVLDTCFLTRPNLAGTPPHSNDPFSSKHKTAPGCCRISQYRRPTPTSHRAPCVAGSLAKRRSPRRRPRAHPSGHRRRP